MVAQQKIEKSAWDALNDLEIFRLVNVRMRNPDVLADELEMNAFELHQALARATALLLAAAPIDADENAVKRQQYLVEQIAADRIAWLFGEAIRGHRRSMQDTTTTRIVGEGDFAKKVVIKRTSCGQPRWLETAAKLAKLALTIPTTAPHDPVLDQLAAEQPARPENPLDEDCSVSGVDRPWEDLATSSDDNSTVSPVMACVESYLATKSPGLRAARPVQPAATPPKQSGRQRAREEFLSGQRT